jgi:hypothetical protein
MYHVPYSVRLAMDVFPEPYSVVLVIDMCHVPYSL